MCQQLTVPHHCAISVFIGEVVCFFYMFIGHLCFCSLSYLSKWDLNIYLCFLLL